LGTTEYIIVEFEKAVFVTQVCVYETFNAGAVVGLGLISAEDELVTIFKLEKPEVLQRSRIFSPKFERPNVKSRKLCIVVNQSAIFVEGETAQIDAVAIFGYEHNFHPEQDTKVSASASAAAENGAQSVSFRSKLWLPMFAFTRLDSIRYIEVSTTMGEQRSNCVVANGRKVLLEREARRSAFVLSEFQHKPDRLGAEGERHEQ
jgi:hypothetical protein